MKAVATDTSMLVLEEYRLSKEFVIPIEYDILLNTNLETEYFNGNVHILINIRKRLNEIKLHVCDLIIHSVKFNGIDQMFSFEEQFDFLVIQTENKDDYPIGYSTLVIKFSSKFSNLCSGFYLSQYKKHDGLIKKIAVSKLEPTYARKVFPCFDQPDMKAKFTISLVFPTNHRTDNYIALSNMNVSKVEDYDESNSIVTFAKSVLMSTYLVCFIICDFDFIEEEITSELHPTFKLRVYSNPEQKDKLKFAHKVAVSVTKFYIDYFNIAYPLPKLDLISIPDFLSGAMEQWGLITFRETALLIDEQIASPGNIKRVAEVIGHELAHMWFGNLVTLDWWNDLWLNEGFASYIEIKGVNHVFPDWKMDNQFIIYVLHDVLDFDSRLCSHPIVQNVITPDQITEIFDQISYDKGASMIRMLEDAMGSVHFQRGIQKYLKKFQYSNAVTSDLWSVLQTFCHFPCEIVDFMNTWTVQKGYPIVHVERDSSNPSIITLTQERFLINPINKQSADEISEYNYKWIIPISMITNNGFKVQVWFLNQNDRLSIELPENTTWFKLNHNQVGYYRVNYHLRDWQLLLDNWKFLNSADQVNLINDGFSIAKAGYLTYEIPLKMVRLLKGSVDHFVWYTVNQEFEFLLSIFINDEVVNHKLSEFIIVIIDDTYNYIKNKNSNLTFLERQAKTVIYNLACLVQHTNCLNECLELFEQWILDETFVIPQEIQSIVLSTGMKFNGTVENWDIIWNRFLKSTDAQGKIRLLNCLANIRNESVVNKLLDIALEGNAIRSQDFFTVLNFVSNNVFFGTNIVWNFVQLNWKKIVDKFTLNNRRMGYIFPSVAKYKSTHESLDQMKKFFLENPDAGAGKNTRKLALETIMSNIAWMDSNKKFFDDFSLQ